MPTIFGGLVLSTTGVPVNGLNRYVHVDALRAFAVMIVVIAHAGVGNIVPGGSGVTIFFSVSGFIITYLVLRERDRTEGFSIGRFYQRRAIKIGPPFAALVIIPTLVYALWIPLDWSAFCSQVFFAYNWVKFQGSHSVLPGSEVVWSLAIEEQFYIVFALIWLLTVKSVHWRKLISAAAVMTILFSLGARILLASDLGTADRIYYGSDTRMDGIAWGALAAVWYHHWTANGSKINRFATFASSKWTLWGAIALYLTSFVITDDWFRDTLRYTVHAISACAIILYGMLPGQGSTRRLFYRISSLPMVNIVGASSYCIYLVHYSLDAVLRPYLQGVPLVGRVALLTLLGVAAGIFFYKVIELPAQRFGQRLRMRGTDKHTVSFAGQKNRTE